MSKFKFKEKITHDTRHMKLITIRRDNFFQLILNVLYYNFGLEYLRIIHKRFKLFHQINSWFIYCFMI